MKIIRYGFILLCATSLYACGGDSPLSSLSSDSVANKMPALAMKDVNNATDDANPSAPEIQQILHELADTRAQLEAARAELKHRDQELSALDQERRLLATEKQSVQRTEAQVQLLEQQLGAQDQELAKLRTSLLQTEAECREVAEQMALSEQAEIAGLTDSQVEN